VSRKDFQILADSLRESILTAEALLEPIGAAAVRVYAKDLAHTLSLNYPRFDEARFLAAAIPS
jgi:hypothetical protein